ENPLGEPSLPETQQKGPGMNAAALNREPAQPGTGLIRRATVEELEQHRNRALDLYAQAFDLLNEAAHAQGSAAQTGPAGPALVESRWGRGKTYSLTERDAFLA